MSPRLKPFKSALAKLDPAPVPKMCGAAIAARRCRRVAGAGVGRGDIGGARKEVKLAGGNRGFCFFDPGRRSGEIDCGNMAIPLFGQEVAARSSAAVAECL